MLTFQSFTKAIGSQASLRKKVISVLGHKFMSSPKVFRSFICKVICLLIKNRSLSIAFSVICFVVLPSNAQEFTPVIPPLPEAAAFAKVSMSNMNYSSGSPSPSIPIHTLTAKSVNVAVGLSYNSSGVRVEDEASMAGLGWTLQYGGMISRTVKGLPDDLGTGGFIHTARTVQWLQSVYHQIESNIAIQDALEGYLDLEPDDFTISIPGYSTSLFYDQVSDSFIQRPYVGLVVESDFVNGRINKWTVTAPNGVKYFFGVSRDLQRVAQETIVSEQTTVRDTQNGYYDVNGAANNSTSVWYLMDIYDPSCNAEIGFWYSGYQQSVCRRLSESKSFDMPGGPGCGDTNLGLKTTFQQMTSLTFRIDKIASSREKIEFAYSPTDREDMQGGKVLQSILVQTVGNEIIKQVNFSFDYFASSQYAQETFCSTPRRLKRLKLNSLSFIDPLGIDPPQIYGFDYQSQYSLPDKFSNAQDYWGYFNGKHGNASMVPKLLVKNNGTYFTVPGAERYVDEQTSEAGILKRIYHPLGAVEEFFYENNFVSTGTDLYPHVNAVLNRLTSQPMQLYQTSSFLNADESTGSYDIYDLAFAIGPDLRSAVKFVLTGCQDYNSTNCDYQLSIVNIATQQVTALNASNLTLSLAPGEYRLVAKVFGDSRNCDFMDPEAASCPGFTIAVSWDIDPLNPGPNTENLLVGSKRVNKILLTGPQGEKLVRKFSYSKFGDTKSSGHLVEIPLLFDITDCSSSITNTINFNAALKVQSRSQLDSSNDIVYTEVTEYLDEEKSQGKTEYEFAYSNPGTYSQLEDLYLQFPFPPRDIRRWRNGVLLKTTYFKQVDSDYLHLKEVENFYSAYVQEYYLNHGYKVDSEPKRTYPAFYHTSLDRYLMDSTVTTTYTHIGPLPEKQRVSTTYKYEDILIHSFPTEIFSIDSKGSKNTTQISYTNSKVVTGNVYEEMMDRNMILPIEEKRSVGNLVVRKQRSNYDRIGANYLLPVSVDVAENGSDYLRVNSIFYSSKADVDEIRKPGDSRVTFLWTEKDAFPVAQIQNASPTQIAYTSFEDNSLNGWVVPGQSQVSSDAVSGERIYDLSSGPITKSNIDISGGRVYLLSFWVKAGTAPASLTIAGETIPVSGDWSLIEIEISQPSIAIAGNGILLDELRLYPKGALFKSYSYSAGKISTACDENAQPTHYKYDGFGRLKTIHDKDRNLVSRNDYFIRQ